MISHLSIAGSSPVADYSSIFATTFGRPPLIHKELTHVMMPRDVELDEIPKDCPDYNMPLGSSLGPSSCILFNPSM